MHSKIFLNAVSVFIGTVFLSSVLMASVYINSPYFEGYLDDFGYSDAINWGGNSTHHNYNLHETLSGEWGCAIFWDDISTEPNAMWLTPEFLYPYWYTNSTFSTSSTGQSWNDPNNPVIGYDTAQSKIVSGDGKVEITIDYEIVDLGENNWSPLAIRDATGQIGFVRSDRFLFLQTYSVKNLQNDANITGLELYQLIHSHGADDYGPVVNASYTNANYNDPLAEYAPYNPVHTVGNFRFDVTQWNEPNDPNSDPGPYTPPHQDWVGFSCTVAPNVHDIGLYKGHMGEPNTGTHKRVKQRSLNNANYLYEETAGAMGWYLPDLWPQESTSITVAFMFGYGPIDYNQPILPPGCEVTLTKTDNVSNCVSDFNSFLGNYLEYTICYSTTCDINDVNIVDTLPADVDFYSASHGGIYDSNLHAVRWTLDNLEANDSNCFTLRVKVLGTAPQGGTLTNTVKMYSGSTLIKTATEHTEVCCLDPVVYVDKDATGANNGTSWTNAYTNLQTALTNVRNGNQGCANQIWVAEGIYKPTNDANLYNETFAMLDGIDVYGHFGGIGTYETAICQRDLSNTDNETILTGDIDDDNDAEISYVVTDANMLLDGFTVRKGYYRGISANNCVSTISNCVIKDNKNSYYNSGDGIYCEGGAQVEITNTFVNNNGYYGIYCYGSGTQVNIDRCTVVSNSRFGLYAYSCTVNATDSVFGGSELDSGIAAYYSNLTVQECDISDNSNIGIYCAGNTTASIQKCTIQRNYYGMGVAESSGEVRVALNIISDNDNYGISVSSNSAVGYFINNLIYSNGYQGMQIENSSEIHNNSIAKNGTYGITRSSGDPNINGNIVWGNDDGSLSGTFNRVNYNCIEGGYSGTGNRSDNPEFRNADVNDYHLTDDSNCINAGGPNFTPDANETDIDGEARVMLNRVDIGADEFYHSAVDIWPNPPDGIVNFFDFAVMAGGWQDSFDISALALLCEEWLWIAGWNLDNGIGGEGAYFAGASCETGGEMMMMQSQSESLTTEPFNVEETLKWLDDLWQSGEIKEAMTEEEYQEFRKSIENAEE